MSRHDQKWILYKSSDNVFTANAIAKRLGINKSQIFSVKTLGRGVTPDSIL